MAKSRRYLIQVNEKSYNFQTSNSWVGVMGKAFRNYLRDTKQFKAGGRRESIIELKITSKIISEKNVRERK